MVVQLRSAPQGTLRHVSNHTQGRRQDVGLQNRLCLNKLNRNCGYGMEGWRSESLPTWVNQQARGPCVSCASSSGQDDTASRIDRYNNSSMDPWDVLGVSPAASEKEIKKAHRRLVLEHHPDRHHVPQEEKKTVVEKRFMKIQEAYEMLMGRRHGHVMGSKEGQNGWNFHDFFWSFNYHRRKKHMQSGGYGRSRPPPPAGAWKEQMSQLKQRAAMRKRREEEEKRKKAASWDGGEDGLFSQISHAYTEGKRHHDEALHRMAGKSSSQIQSFQRIFSTNTMKSASQSDTEQYVVARGSPSEEEGEGEAKAQDDAYEDGASGTSSTGSGVSHQLAGLKRRAELKKRILHE